MNKTPTLCFRLNVFRLKKLNKWNFSQWRQRLVNIGGMNSSAFLSLPLPSPPTPSLPGGPNPLIRLGVLGERLSSPSGSGQSCGIKPPTTFRLAVLKRWVHLNNKLYLLVSAFDPQGSGVKCYYVSLPLPSWGSQPPNTASGSGGALKLPQRVRGRQTVSGTF